MSDILDLGTVAVLGFGHQGEAHAHNLRAAGVNVIVGARAGPAAAAAARAAGFAPRPLAEAAISAAVRVVLLPDEILPSLWPELAAARGAEGAWVFAHGYNLLYSALDFGARADVVLVSPTSPGHVLRAARERGERIPAYLAVHRDRTGAAWDLAERYAERVGCGPLWRTTVREETEVDLFGEQAVLCGGMNALVTAAFETLTAAGYAPEVAYLECVHQLRYLAELLHERGVAGMRGGISGTALFGDVTRGPLVIGAESRAAMRRILEEIRGGAFAREWAAEAASGGPRTRAALARASEHPIEAARRSALGLPATAAGPRKGGSS